MVVSGYSLQILQSTWEVNLLQWQFPTYCKRDECHCLGHLLLNFPIVKLEEVLVNSWGSSATVVKTIAEQVQVWVWELKEAFLMQETVDREATKLIRKCSIFCNPVGSINIWTYTNPSDHSSQRWWEIDTCQIRDNCEKKSLNMFNCQATFFRQFKEQI